MTSRKVQSTKVPFHLLVSNQIHIEMKRLSEQLGTSMTALYITGGLKEARNRARALKIVEQQTSTDYSNR